MTPSSCPPSGLRRKEQEQAAEGWQIGPHPTDLTCYQLARRVARGSRCADARCCGREAPAEASQLAAAPRARPPPC